MMPREAGVLLHPTSLPNTRGRPGQLNDQAWRFLEWMQAAGLTIWQMLPLNPPHENGSPYQAVSAFARNPALLPDGWEQACDPQALAAYLQDPPHWLEDYALFMVIRETQQLRSWCEWPAALKARDPHMLAAFAAQHRARLHQIKQQQFALQQIWRRLKADAQQMGIALFGDLPLFVAYDSADVWANPELFLLDAQLKPTVVSGVPPDYFSVTGQRWGNPHYDWERMQQRDFIWWRQRVAEALNDFDLLRIDHFRGLEAVWAIEADAPGAIQGQWMSVPGEALLNALKADFPSLPLVAEDLGIITPEVVALKERFGLPGMSVLQFGFDGLPENPHALEGLTAHSVTYTGTHDNNTALGWFESLDTHTQQGIAAQLEPQARALLERAGLSNPALRQMPWPLILAALNSVSERVIVPMQDWLMLDGTHRMNVPGTSEGNWRWQLQWAQVPPDLAETVRMLLAHTRRRTADTAEASNEQVKE
jgi:4-alpha-glucanotransferase